MSRKKQEIHKQDLAWWEKDALVNIWVLTTPSDPELYQAKCLTAGTFPVLQVLKGGNIEPHPKYIKPLHRGEYVIWGYAEYRTPYKHLEEVQDEVHDDGSYIDTCDFSFVW